MCYFLQCMKKKITYNSYRIIVLFWVWNQKQKHWFRNLLYPLFLYLYSLLIVNITSQRGSFWLHTVESCGSLGQHTHTRMLRILPSFTLVYALFHELSLGNCGIPNTFSVWIRNSENVFPDRQRWRNRKPNNSLSCFSFPHPSWCALRWDGLSEAQITMFLGCVEYKPSKFYFQDLFVMVVEREKSYELTSC